MTRYSNAEQIADWNGEPDHRGHVKEVDEDVEPVAERGLRAHGRHHVRDHDEQNQHEAGVVPHGYPGA